MKERSKIRKAVSAIFKYKSQFFLIKRQNFLRVFPGYTSFPGGKVESTDETMATQLSEKYELESSLMGALYREIKEELGVDLNELDNSNIIKNIRLSALATTPDFNPHRFETFFILIDLNKKIDFELDFNEVSVGAWQTAQELEADYKQAKVLIVPPILKYILSFNEHSSDLAPVDLIDEFDSKKVPMLETVKGLVQYMPLSNTLPPATRTNAFLIGDIRKFLVDPSPKDRDEMEKLENTIAFRELAGIFITHHHGDHHEFAPDLARKYNLAMYMSELTHEYMIKKRGVEYLAGIKIIFSKQDDILTTSLGSSVIVHEVPGHDLGQLALAPKNKAWFIAGDLFQGVGTVVVGGDEADMKQYMESLEYVIKLAPQCVVPSHGIALGGTNILERTLEHRKYREKQILGLYKKGQDPERILKSLYFDIPEYLHKYALKNIEAHLEKLKVEKII